jgi:hypothetical protein
MGVASRLFCFKRFEKERVDLSSETFGRPILSGRLPHIANEVYRISEITDQVNRLAQEEVTELKIERIYATDFAFELVSPSIALFSKWSKLTYDNLCRRLFSFIFDFPKPTPAKIRQIKVDKVQVNSVVVFRFVLCDNLTELQSISKELKLLKKSSTFYLGGEQGSSVNDNTFNYVSDVWQNLYLPNTMATVKPEKLDYKAQENLFYLMCYLHSLGKFYVMTESARGTSANLEWSSWYINTLFDKYEAALCWTQKNFSDATKNLTTSENKIRELALPLTLIITNPEAIDLIQQQYGEDFYGVDRGLFFHLVKDDRIKDYVFPSVSDFSGDELFKSFSSSLKSLASSIRTFLAEFRTSAESWKDVQRSKRAQNQLLVSFSGVILTLVVSIIARFV